MGAYEETPSPVLYTRVEKQLDACGGGLEIGGTEVNGRSASYG